MPAIIAHQRSADWGWSTGLRVVVNCVSFGNHADQGHKDTVVLSREIVGNGRKITLRRIEWHSPVGDSRIHQPSRIDMCGGKGILPRRAIVADETEISAELQRMIASTPGKIIVQVLHWDVKNTGAGKRDWVAQAGQRHLRLVGNTCLAAGLSGKSVVQNIDL